MTTAPTEHIARMSFFYRPEDTIAKIAAVEALNPTG